jgi:hypothetical protein
MSAAECSLKDLLCPLSQIRLRLEGRKNGRSLALPPDSPTGRGSARVWSKLSFRKLIHQMVEFLTHRAHAVQCTDNDYDRPPSDMWTLPSDNDPG